MCGPWKQRKTDDEIKVEKKMEGEVKTEKE